MAWVSEGHTPRVGEQEGGLGAQGASEKLLDCEEQFTGKLLLHAVSNIAPHVLWIRTLGSIKATFLSEELQRSDPLSNSVQDSRPEH